MLLVGYIQLWEKKVLQTAHSPRSWVCSWLCPDSVSGQEGAVRHPRFDLPSLEGKLRCLGTKAAKAMVQ